MVRRGREVDGFYLRGRTTYSTKVTTLTMAKGHPPVHLRIRVS